MKASEVFDLPVSAGEYNMDNDNIYGASGDGEWCATFFSDEQAKVAASCINHADALADALELLLPHIESHRELGVVGEKAQYDAVSALAAYRGAK